MPAAAYSSKLIRDQEWHAAQQAERAYQVPSSPTGSRIR
jgi:hypothetical protein